MKLNKDNAEFFQNRFNYYIGDIIINETLYIEDDYIIIGNINTPNNIVSKGNLIVIGDIKSRSLYAFKDLCCKGKMDIDIEEVEGKLKKVENFNSKTINNKEMSYLKRDKDTIEEKLNIKSNNNIKLEEKNNDNINKEIVDKTKNKIQKISFDEKLKNEHSDNHKIKRIYSIEDIKIGDVVKHNTLGEGEILNLNNSKIHVNFIKKGKRFISTDITLKLGLLKKYLDNTNIAYEKEKKTEIIKHDIIKVKKEIINYRHKKENLSEEELYIKKLCKNKSITFYYKYINEYILETEDPNLKKYIFHYIKFRDIPYVRFNHICEVLDSTNSIQEKFIKDESIKISYKDRCINGIKFITLEDCKRILNGYSIINNKISILEKIIFNIEKDCNLNLANATPYWSEVIERILNYKQMNIDEIAEIWNIKPAQINIVKLGYAPQMTKLRQLIKDNEIIDEYPNIGNIRKIKYINSIKFDEENLYGSNKVVNTDNFKKIKLYDKSTKGHNLNISQKEKSIYGVNKLMLNNRDVNINIKRQLFTRLEVSELCKKQSIGFKEDAIYKFAFNKIDSEIIDLSFDYIKYEDKIYARVGHINEILNATLYVEDIIKVRYVDKSISNVKFASMKNLLKSINKLDIEGVYENKEMIEKSIDYILKNKSLIKASTPYWALVLDSLINDLSLQREEVYNEFLLSEYDMELMSVGLAPIKKESKARIQRLL